MKCSDIADEIFLAAVDATEPMGPNMGWRSRWDVRETLQALLEIEIPENLFMAKARKLIAKKKMDGCPCGCRGDFETKRPPASR